MGDMMCDFSYISGLWISYWTKILVYEPLLKQKQYEFTRINICKHFNISCGLRASEQNIILYPAKMCGISAPDFLYTVHHDKNILLKVEFEAISRLNRVWATGDVECLIKNIAVHGAWYYHILMDSYTLIRLHNRQRCTVEGVSRRLQHSYLGYNCANRLIRQIKQVNRSLQRD